MIFVVEDDEALRLSMVDFLESAGRQVQAFEDAEAALAAATASLPDAVVTDLSLPGMSGLDLIEALNDLDAGLIRILMTAHGSVSSAVKAIRLGCYEYLEKPVDLVRLLRLVDRAVEDRRRQAELEWHRGRGASTPTVAAEEKNDDANLGLVGVSTVMADLRERILQAASLPHPGPPILITGPTGVGKTRVARAIHDAVDPEKVFLQVNCGALPESLIEAELFGHEKSAFTDAKSARPGLFEAASGGTLFLDEIGELPVSAQAKLLDVVERGVVRRLGGVRERSVEVRLLAATHVELEEAVREKTFRADLYHRLRGLVLEVPALAARPDDVMPLASTFLEQAAAKYGRTCTGFTTRAQEVLGSYAWPGNVRELQFAVERAVVSGKVSGELLSEDGLALLSPTPAPAELVQRERPSAQGGPGEGTITWNHDVFEVHLPEQGVRFDDIERALIRAALQTERGRVTRAAELLGLGRDQLRYRMKRLGIHKDEA